MRITTFSMSLLIVVGCKSHDGASVPDGRVLCWGLDQSGQLGASEGGPIRVAAAGADATAILAVNVTTCARSAGTGAWKCWGSESHALAALFELSDVVTIRAADSHACGLRTNGTVACTGDDARRIAFEAASVPDPMTSKQLYEVRTDAKGNTQVKPVGDAPPPANVETPKYAVLPNITDAVEIAVGDDHGCVRRTGGGVACWGASQFGQIGNGTADRSVTYGTPQAVADITDATAIAAGGEYSCAVRAGGSVWCWGSLKSSLTNADSHPRPEQIAGVTGATAVAITTDEMGDRQRACAVVAEGRAVCWTASDATWPIKGVSGITQIVAGMAHTCARLATGHVACWGDDHNGEIDPGHIGSSSPEIPGITNVAEVAVGARHTCVRRAP